MDRDYLNLIEIATKLAGRDLCPMCEAFKPWKTIEEPMELPIRNTDEPAAVLPLCCGECGYIHLFLVSYLEKKAANLQARQDGH